MVATWIGAGPSLHGYQGASMQRARVHLTPDRIRRFSCPANQKQDFLWDTEAPRLAVRATAGAKSYVFEAKLNRRTIRCTIGDVADWTTEDARTEARRLARLIDRGVDPRDDRARRDAEAAAQREEAARREVIFSDAWRAYLAASHPTWGARYRTDHDNLARPGGEKWKRGERKTNAGPIAAWMARPLRELGDSECLTAWLRGELAKRPTQTRLGFG